MVQFRIDVVIEPARAVAGTQAIERGLGRIEDRGKQINSLLAKLGLGISVALGIRETLRAVDTYQRLQNQLRIVADTQEEANQSFEDLLGIANRTRTELGSIVTLYQRASIASSELGASNAEMLKFVERVGQGLAIQGGSAAAASGALLQLSQALGSGIVRAEEFNSVLEGAFPVAQAAARGIEAAGGSVAKLRQLIATGQVTSREFFDGILKGSDETAAAFEKSVPTISQQFTVFKNELITTVGEMDKAAGSSRLLGEALRFVADQARNARDGLEVFAEALGSGLAEAASEEALNLNLIGRQINNLAKRSGLDQINKQIAGVQQQIKDLEGQKNIFGLVDPEAFIELVRLKKELIDLQVLAEAARANAAKAAKASADEAASAARQSSNRKAQRLAELQEAARKATQAAPGLRTGDRPPTAPAGPTKAEKERADDLAEFIRRLDLETIALTRAANQRGAFTEAIDLEFEARKKLGTLSEEEGKRFLQQAAANRILQERAAILEDLGGAERDMIIRQAALNQLFDEGKITLAEYNKLLAENRLRGLEASTDLAAGFERAFLKMELEAQNFAAAAEQAVNVFADHATNAIVTFFREGELSSKDFTRELLLDLAQIAARMAVVAGLSALFGPGGGALGGTLFGSLSGRQHGGPVQRGRPYIVGERRPEVFVPNQPGQVLPSTAAPVVESKVQVNNFFDPADIPRAMDSPAGETVVMNIVSRNSSKMRRILS